MTQATITVRFTQEGFHYWPGAADIDHRKYLSAPHRHLFHVEVSTTVTHDDREIEFHDLRYEAIKVFSDHGDGIGNFQSWSCELLARYLGKELALKHKRSFWISVFEDGECGATVFCPRP